MNVPFLPGTACVRVVSQCVWELSNLSEQPFSSCVHLDIKACNATGSRRVRRRPSNWTCGSLRVSGRNLDYDYLHQRYFGTRPPRAARAARDIAAASAGGPMWWWAFDSFPVKYQHRFVLVGACELHQSPTHNSYWLFSADDQHTKAICCNETEKLQCRIMRERLDLLSLLALFVSSSTSACKW